MKLKEAYRMTLGRAQPADGRPTEEDRASHRGASPRGRSTEEQLATKLRITLKCLQRVEAGRHNLAVDSLMRFSRALKAEPKVLFEEPRSL